MTPFVPRWSWAVAIGLVLTACGGASSTAGGPPTLDLEDVDRADRFGVGPDVGRATPAGVRFRFRGRRDPAVRSALVYARLAPASRIEIRLNGVALATVAPSEAFRSAPELLLPPALLRGDDELSFVPTAAGTWQIGEVRVIVDPVPSCEGDGCAATARELFERGARLHADRGVAAENLARATALLREALLHVERIDPPPPLRGHVAALLARASSELDERCRGLRFAAVGQVHLGRWDEVRATARAMEARFPAADHPCRRTARRLLDRLASMGEDEP